LYISKSKYLTGLQCPKSLWINYNAKWEIPEVDDSLQAIFDQGHEVGEWAKKVFPHGMDIDWDAGFDEVIKQSKEMLSKRIPLFEPGFVGDSTYSRIDILNPAGADEWDIIEVKSTTNPTKSDKIDEVYLHDISFQKYCCLRSGLKIRNTYLMYLNKEYVKQGDINPGKLFIIKDVTESVNNFLDDVGKNVEHMLNIIRGPRPEVDIGSHCKSPYDCALIPVCRSFLPENNVFNLTRIGKEAYNLLSQGVYKIEDIPHSFGLTSTQALQRETVLRNQIHVEPNRIREFLAQLEYPVHYFDIETSNPAVPLYDGMKPYQHYPFQYSLHIQDENNEDEHLEFLHTEPSDPRPAILESMRQSFKEKGSIVVYYESFERRNLQDLADAFPEYKKWVDDIINRFVDLHDLFKEFSYYDPAQKGSTSLKATLPSLTGMGYDDLEISDGSAAMREYRKIAFGPQIPEEEKEQKRKHLLKYCEMDTEGMIRMMEILREMV